MQEELLEAYKNDYMKLTLDDVVNTIPIGSLYFSEKEMEKGDSYGTEHSCPVYPQFTNTIELAQSYGFDYNEKLDVDDVESIFVYYTGKEKDETETEYDDFISIYKAERLDDYTNGLEYKDKEAVRKIADSIAYTAFRSWSYNYAADLYDDDYQIAIDFVGGDVSHARRYMFRSGEIPDFVPRDYSYVK